MLADYTLKNHSHTTIKGQIDLVYLNALLGFYNILLLYPAIISNGIKLEYFKGIDLKNSSVNIFVFDRAESSEVDCRKQIFDADNR